MKLGNVYRNPNELRQAKEYFDKAFGVSIAISDRTLEAMALLSLAHVSNAVNDSQKAKEHCEEALTIIRERKHEARLYLDVGYLSQSFG